MRRKKTNPKIVLTNESGAENFNDIFANRLIHYDIWPGYVPLFSTVYHNYVTFYGRSISLKGRKNKKDPKPQMKIGWQLVMGNQIGRIRSSTFAKSKYDNMGAIAQKNLSYLKEALKVRKIWSKYLDIGKMLKPPYLLTDIPTVTTHEFRKDKDCSLPGILASTWQAPDGSVAMVVTNISKKEMDVTLGLDKSVIVNHSVQQVYPDKKSIDIKSQDSVDIVSIKIKPRHIKVIEWK